jgi:hypothetical protein
LQDIRPDNRYRYWKWPDIQPIWRHCQINSKLFKVNLVEMLFLFRWQQNAIFKVQEIKKANIFFCYNL